MSKETYPLKEIPVVTCTKVIKMPGEDLEPYYEIHYDDGKITNYNCNTLTAKQIEDIDRYFIHPEIRNMR